MINESINFQQERSVGEVLSASFAFLRQEFKLLFSTLLMYVGPLVLLAGISMGYMIYGMVTRMSEFQLDPNNPLDVFNMYPWKTVLMTMLFATAMYVLMLSIIYAYVHVYIENGTKQFTRSQVWEIALQKMGGQISVMLLFIPIVILMMIVGGIFIAAFSLISPVIGVIAMYILMFYVMITISLTSVAKAFEDIPAFDSIGRSFSLIRNNWWRTFGLYIVIGLLLCAFLIVLQIILGLSAFVAGDLFSTGNAPDKSMMAYVMVPLGVIMMMVYFVYYVLLYIAQTFHYFSLVQQKESPNLDDRINRINDTDNL